MAYAKMLSRFVGVLAALGILGIGATEAFASSRGAGAVCDFNWTGEACGLGGDDLCSFCCMENGHPNGGLCVSGNTCLCY